LRFALTCLTISLVETVAFSRMVEDNWLYRMAEMSKVTEMETKAMAKVRMVFMEWGCCLLIDFLA
jgi:hypothetical protein